MFKNPITGSILAKLLPSVHQFFLENASQEEVNAAEQEAAVLHQQLNNLGETQADNGATVTEGTPTDKPLDTTSMADLTAQVTALTTRASNAESKVTELQGKLTAAEADRDKYKAWYDKQTNKGTALPKADATTRGESSETANLSAASAAALAVFRKGRV